MSWVNAQCSNTCCAYQALADEVRGARPEGTFVALLDVWLRTISCRGLPDGAWEDFLTALHREAIPRLGSPDVTEARLHQARVLLRETARQEQWKEYTQLARRTQGSIPEDPSLLRLLSGHPTVTTTVASTRRQGTGLIIRGCPTSANNNNGGLSWCMPL